MSRSNKEETYLNPAWKALINVAKAVGSYIGLESTIDDIVLSSSDAADADKLSPIFNKAISELQTSNDQKLRKLLDQAQTYSAKLNNPISNTIKEALSKSVAKTKSKIEEAEKKSNEVSNRLGQLQDELAQHDSKDATTRAVDRRSKGSMFERAEQTINKLRSDINEIQ